MELVVLRDLQRPGLAGPFNTGTRDFNPRAAEWKDLASPPEPHISVETTDVKRRNELARDPEVVAVTPVMPTRLVQPLAAAAAPDGDAWGVASVGADVSQYSGAGTCVAVLDTGVDVSHPALAGVTTVVENFTGGGPEDHQGHGTHCAGTILGRDVDGARIGIARGVDRLLVGKVLSDDGGGTSEMVFRGIRWAVEQGAQVVSMSLGFDFPGMVTARVKDNWPVDLATSAALEAYRGNVRMFDALMAMVQAQEAFNGGCIVVAAAGNESKRDVNPDYEIAASLPAAALGVCSVGALSQSAAGMTVASFSNSFPTLCAPGVDIKSARVGGGFQTMSGTSMACPHVAGVAALWWEAVKDLGLPANARTVSSRLLATCRLDGFAPTVEVTDRGSGLVSSP